MAFKNMSMTREIFLNPVFCSSSVRTGQSYLFVQVRNIDFPLNISVSKQLFVVVVIVDSVDTNSLQVLLHQIVHFTFSFSPVSFSHYNPSFTQETEKVIVKVSHRCVSGSAALVHIKWKLNVSYLGHACSELKAGQCSNRDYSLSQRSAEFKFECKVDFGVYKTAVSPGNLFCGSWPGCACTCTHTPTRTGTHQQRPQIHLTYFQREF